MAVAVVNTEQLFKGKVLEVKRIWRVKMKDEEKLRNQENSGETELTTVEVHGLPEWSTENSVYIHFQKKKNGGGEVKKVAMLGDGKARVTFEDPQGGLKFSISALCNSKREQDCIPVDFVDNFLNFIISLQAYPRSVTF